MHFHIILLCFLCFANFAGSCWLWWYYLMILISMILMILMDLYVWENNISLAIFLLIFRLVNIFFIYIIVTIFNNVSTISILCSILSISLFFSIIYFVEQIKQSNVKKVKENFSVSFHIFPHYIGKHININTCRSIPIIQLYYIQWHIWLELFFIYVIIIKLIRFSFTKLIRRHPYFATNKTSIWKAG